MPVEFACPSCKKQYRVKDELAGKSAKCGKCGNRMKIPALPATEIAPLVEAPLDQGFWMDDELNAPPPARATSAGAPRSPVCKGCGAPLAPDVRVCLLCGYDTQTGTVRAKKTTERPGRQTGLGATVSLLRGTALSFVFATVGAIIWAVVAWLTSYQFGFIAWGLGGLAGFGMALGHEDDDGTMAGIIAAFMSLVGIIMAKILIIVIVVAAVVVAVANQAPDAQNFDQDALQRQMLSASMAGEKLKEQGINLEQATEEQWKQATASARAEVDKLSKEEVAERLKKQMEAEEAEENERSAKAGNDAQGPAAVPDIPVAEAEPPGLVGLFFSSMFRPMDGLFILLAFFTAYKVGSGKMTD